MEKYKDCYASWTENTLVIGNKRIERRFQWCAQGLVCTATVDKASAKEWRGDEPPAVTPDVAIECAVSNNGGLSAKHLLLTATERQTVLINVRLTVKRKHRVPADATTQMATRMGIPSSIVRMAARMILTRQLPGFVDAEFQM